MALLLQQRGILLWWGGSAHSRIIDLAHSHPCVPLVWWFVSFMKHLFISALFWHQALLFFVASNSHFRNFQAVFSTAFWHLERFVAKYRYRPCNRSIKHSLQFTKSVFSGESMGRNMKTSSTSTYILAGLLFTLEIEPNRWTVDDTDSWH